jgi:hypothetical protein
MKHSIAAAAGMSAAVVTLCCLMGSAPALAIDCMSAPGDPKSGWYSWREIDGRKCWFLRTGTMPAKSQLRWAALPAAKVRSVEPVAAAAEDTAPVAEPPATSAASGQAEGEPASQLRFRIARVRPAAAPRLQLGHGLDLMSGASLTVNTPPSLAPADPFHARFTGARN